MSDVESTRRSELVAELYAQHGEKLRAFLYGVLRNVELASEALQNTFRQAVRALPEGTPDGIRGWLFRVAYNEAMLIRRKARVASDALQRMVESRAVETPGGGSGGETAQRIADDPLVKRETIERVHRALENLPRDQRYVVEQRIYGEKTFAAIAEELDVPLGTVLTRNRLALEKLRAALSETESSPRE